MEALFNSPGDDKYLLQMAASRGGLRRIQVAMVPAPPGWPGQGSYWIVFHTYQMIEEDHDVVCKVVSTPKGMRVGPEIPEDDLAGWRIDRQQYTARLTPENSTAMISDKLWLRKGSAQRAPVFRLNDIYSLSDPNLVVETEQALIRPRAGQTVRAGSLLIPWTDQPEATYAFNYSVEMSEGRDDEITSTDAYLTGWWLPTLGQLPYTVEGAIEAPAKWIVRGEGNIGPVEMKGDRKVSHFSCPLPISFPKVIGGLYTLAAEKTTADGAFRIYQMAPLDPLRASVDLKNMVDAAAFYGKVLGPLPFRGYECYDAYRYYGIESYSHTLLQRSVTHFISHEMGHSYFGGMAPCAYVHDTWNEGVTQYLDSVGVLGNSDGSLEKGLKTVGLNVPLSQMPIPWQYGDASYFRGCYVVKMLEAEIGLPRVYAALRSVATERKGLDTRWADLRPYFEKAGGKKLDWFWNQWVVNGTFPTLTWSHSTQPDPKGGFVTTFSVSQSGTAQPFRLRFRVQAGAGAEFGVQQVVLDEKSKAFEVKTAGNPTAFKLDVLPLTLATVKEVPSKPVSAG